MWETWVQLLGLEDPLEKGMATHSNILAWRILWTEELGRLQSMQSQQESDTTERLSLIPDIKEECRRRQWHPTPVLLPRKSHGLRSLVGCSPWGQEESDVTERLHFHFSLLCIGEGNGNPLQCSCLENPRDGVTQSQKQLK